MASRECSEGCSQRSALCRVAALQKKFPKHWPVFLFLIVILLSFVFFFFRFLSELSFLGPHSVKHLAASFVAFFMQKKNGGPWAFNHITNVCNIPFTLAFVRLPSGRTSCCRDGVWFCYLLAVCLTSKADIEASCFIEKFGP